MRLMDRNSNGYIDFDDFVNLLADKCKEELTITELNTFFDRYDESNKKLNLKNILFSFREKGFYRRKRFNRDADSIQKWTG